MMGGAHPTFLSTGETPVPPSKCAQAEASGYQGKVVAGAEARPT